MNEFLCSIEEALELQRLCLSEMAARYFIDRKSKKIFSRMSVEFELAKYSCPNDLVPTWTVLDLGRALGKEISMPDFTQLEVINTCEYSGLRNERTDRWHTIAGQEACFANAGEPSNRARLLIYCLHNGLLRADIVNQSLTHYEH